MRTRETEVRDIENEGEREWARRAQGDRGSERPKKRGRTITKKGLVKER